MRYRDYGRTGKQISVIGFGGMRFTENEEEGVRAMVRAAELGVTFFDTAPGYCRDRSEIIFGKGFAEIQKKITNPVYVSTKSSIGDQPRAGDIRSRIDQALKRMGIPKISFFHMWCIMNWEHFQRVTAADGPYQGALAAKKEGLIEHVVFSTHANGSEIRQMCNSGLFEGVLLGYNIFNHSNRHDGILAASENGMGVVIMNPLGGGMVPAGAEQLEFIRTQHTDSIVQAALRFVVSEPGVTCALTGMGTIAEVEENAAVGDSITRPDAELVAAIKEAYQDLGEAFCTGCNYCQPCPAGIDIRSILFALNRHRIGMTGQAPGYYEFMRKFAGDKWVLARDCTDCEKCEQRCTQHLPVRKRLQEASALFESDL